MSPGELEPGTVLSGTYEIVRRIGAGGMGAVYEARHLRLAGRKVAIKVLLRELADDAEAFARFRREAEIAARLGHPNIVNVTDWDHTPDGAPFMAMDLLVGEDLGRRLERGPLALAEALRILQEVGAALTAAHRQGVVHRDLKPQNIFLVPVEGPVGIVHHAKILDFGISKITGAHTRLTQDAAVLGTPQYMAPEQALGRMAEIDARTDQFALAAIAYELLTGEPAFAAPSVTAALYKVVHEQPPPLAEKLPMLPRHVADTIARGLAKEPAQRFADVESFLAALSQPASPSRPGSAKQRRMAAWLAVGTALLVAGAVVSSLSVVKKRRVMVAVSTRDVPGGSDVSVPPVPKIEVLPPAPPPPASAAIRPPPPPEPTHRSVALRAGPKPVEESPEVKAKLDEAEQAFAAGQYDESIRLAKQVLRKSPRASNLLTRSYCGQRDLGNANAALHSVAAGERAAVVRACLRLGVELQ